MRNDFWGLILSLFIASCFAAAQQTKLSSKNELDKVYADESHCLTSPDMRNDQDAPISCYCRDSIVIARYVHQTYTATFKDPNLNGALLTLITDITRTCGVDNRAANDIVFDQEWKWRGPEVVRTYPPDDAIKRIKLEPYVRGGRSLGRWVPYTIQLVYRDAKGQILKTENFASREYFPDFEEMGKHPNK